MVELDGVSYTREFCLSSNLGKLYNSCFEPKTWPISPDGTRMLKGGMRDEVGYKVQKTAEEALRHVLYKMTGRY